MSELMNIPNLRFPDFSDDWQVSKLGDVTSKIGSGSTPRGGEEVYTSDGILFIRSQNVKRNILDLTDSTFIPEEVHFQMSGSEVKSNDVLLNITGASIGRSCVVPSSVITGNVNQHVCIVRTGRHLEPNFLQPFLASRRGQKLIYQGQTGSGREGLNFQSIRSFKLSLPTKPEQQKIAAFLTAVDNKIEQLSKKQALLGEYKKGLMQQIFSQAIRFKADDDSEFPDWEERVLGDYLAHKSKKNKNNEVDLVLSVSNKKGFITQDEQFDGYQVASKDLTNYKIVEKGEYAYNPSRINVGSIARLKNNTIGIVSPMYVVFKLKNLDSIFFDNLYQTHLFKHLIKVGCSGSVRDSLNFNDMADFVFSFPSLEEQAKIANFLSSIDSKIEQVGKQLDESKQFKKALLQQMFV